MDFRALGALEVWDGGRRVLLPNRYQRVLAALLLAPNSPVPVARLIAATWDGEPPVTATKQVQNCVSVLREKLGGGSDLIVRDGSGYRLVIGDEQLDVSRFQRQLETAQRLAADGRFADAVDAARRALMVWRGPALEGLDSVALSGPAGRLDERRVNAVELCADWQLELGQHAAAIDQLTDLVAQYPLRERPHAQLMIALDRGGRQVDALAVFQDLRTRMIDELGVDPGTELHELHARILARIPSPGTPEATAVSAPAKQTYTPSAQLDRAMSHLAAAITRQWTAEAETRSLNRPGPIALTWSSTRRPVSAVVAATEVGAGRQHRVTITGDLGDVVAKFRQVPSQQMVVLGEPGAGKSVLAIMLTLGLLSDARPGEPIPILLSLASWNPHQQHLHQWLAARLREEHPGLDNADLYGPDAATRLVLDGKVLPILDGLDETPPALHAAAIDALDSAVARGRPLVVTCRAAEYEHAVTHTGSLLTRAVVIEIGPVELDAAITFLIARTTAADTRWNPVVEYLRDRPDSALARALRTPLMIDLASSAYTAPDTDPAELCDSTRFPGLETIEGHLLDRYLPTTYTSRPSPPARYSRPSTVRAYPPRQAERWLTFLACQLHRQSTRELAWWNLDRAVPRYVSGLYLSVPSALLFAATGWLAAGPVTGLLYGLCFGLAGGVAHSVGHRPGPLQVEVRFHQRVQRFLRRFAVGVTIGIAFGLGWSLPGGVTGLLALTFGVAVGSHVWLAMPVEADRVSSPATVLYGDRTATWAFTLSLMVSLGLFYGVAFALTHDAGYGKTLGGAFDLGPAVAASLAAGLLGYFLRKVAGAIAYGLAGFVVGGLVFPHADSHGDAIVAGIVFGLAVGSTVCLARAWGRYTLTRLWLALRKQLPLNLMRFLDDAHHRGVLRQVGAVYQFRHARLQDRLATRMDP